MLVVVLLLLAHKVSEEMSVQEKKLLLLLSVYVVIALVDEKLFEIQLWRRQCFPLSFYRDWAICLMVSLFSSF